MFDKASSLDDHALCECVFLGLADMRPAIGQGKVFNALSCDRSGH